MKALRATDAQAHLTAPTDRDGAEMAPWTRKDRGIFGTLVIHGFRYTPCFNLLHFT